MKKIFLRGFIFFSILLGVINPGTAKAIEEELLKNNPDTSVLIVYSTEHWEVDENIRLLDLSIGHFSNNIEYQNVHNLEQDDLEDKTHLFYYGHVREELPSTVPDLFSSFDGPIMAISYNTEQLGEKYSFMDVGEEKSITKLDYLGKKEKTRKIEPNIIFDVKLDEKAETLVEGSGEQGTFPLIMRENENYYLAADSFDRPYSAYFSQALNEFFDTTSHEISPAYIRLEDVHPLTDPKRLMAAAKELAKRDIPYMIAVIPVYTDPETGRTYHFEDEKEVLKALRYMQDNGGSVILHGYTHQFRQTETGEGFEFWDVEHQMPIYHGPEDEVVKLSADDFENQEQYEAFEAENKKYERQYIEDRLTRGVQELVTYGLYPLAFEAPHYTMSQNGYEVASNIFSTYVGQVQLSDEDWEIMDTTPYASEPAMLNGMVLLPETIGYVQPDESDPIDNMMDAADFYQVADGGVIGSFYHPYLGVEGLRDVLDEMEEIENLEWIDLKNLDNTVKVDHVTIQSGNGEIKTKINKFGLILSSTDFVYYRINETVILITWIIAGLGIIAVITFLCFTVYLGIRRRRLERRALEHS